jgi:pimeloyl-ACP methyl ester carboxylesterase
VAEDTPIAQAAAPFREFRYLSGDGLGLVARDYGDPNGPNLPVVCLPGLTRTARDYHTLAVYLARDRQRPRRVVAFDYRGRGRSDWDKNAANYAIGVETNDVLDGMAAIGIPRTVVIGTSRGGIIGMAMAFARQQAVAALVLNDIGPLVEPKGLVRLKSYVGRTPMADDWADAVRIQRRLHGSQFTAFDEADWEQFARLTYRDTAGRPESDYDPRLAETLGGDIDQPSPGLWDEFRALRSIPILVIRGSNSDILSAATAERMAAEHPRLETLVVADEGHPPQVRGPMLVRIAAFIAGVEDAIKSAGSSAADVDEASPA